MRVVLADDEALLVEGLARLLGEAGVEVVGKAATAPRPSLRGADPAGRGGHRHPHAARPHR